MDDNRTLLSVACRHLAKLGYKVVSAASGPAALAILVTGEAVDLLFTDVLMPDGMSGFELAEAAQHLRPNLKVLYTTGYAGRFSEHDKARMLLKPYGRHDLACAVRSSLDRPITTDA